jgi:menaquinone-9 beta-reductase
MRAMTSAPAPNQLRFDVLILGSGPAGSAAARVAALAGLRVALLDKSRFPREKLCGGGITGRCGRYLEEVFDLSTNDALFLETTRFRLTYQGRTLTSEEATLHMTMRRDFDAALQGAAINAGAQVFAPVRVRNIDPQAGQITLEDGRVLAGQVLIGADGANSAMARAVYGRAFDPEQIGFGLEAELPRALTDDNTVEVDLGAAAWGYGWVFPKQGSITVGVGGIHARNPDMKAHFARYVQRHAPDMADTPCKGAFLPFGAFRPVPGAGRVLLAGDAAGLVDPITGEGIAWAIKSGQYAGEAVVEALTAHDPARALPAYQRRIAYIHTEMTAARRIRAVIYAPILRDLFPRTVAASPTMARTYLRLLGGEIDYTDIRKNFFLRLARRMGHALFSRNAKGTP